MLALINRIIDPMFNYRRKNNITRNWNAQFIWKLQDLWIGAFWKRPGLCVDLWICFIPCVPLHISWWKERCPNCDAVVKKLGKSSDGRKFCCIHCCFNPEGCRCKHGDFGKPETNYYF